MNSFFLIVASIPFVLWGFGGFKIHELWYERYRLFLWYGTLGVLYAAYRIMLALFW